MMRRGGRGNNFGLALLALNIAQVGLDNIPPGTLALGALNLAFFLGNPLGISVAKACLNPARLLERQEWTRLFLAPFYHLDDFHLYYNMTSLVWKGRKLELRLGTTRFVALSLLLALWAGLIHIVIAWTLMHVFQYADSFYTCSAGFSGVLFGFKVVLTSMSPDGVGNVMGFPIANRYTSWAELLLMSLIMPRVSFLGHLSGILAGSLYLTGVFEPLLEQVDRIPSVLNSFLVPPQGQQGQAPRRYMQDGVLY